MSEKKELRKRKIINDAYLDFLKVLINQDYENINKYIMECKPYAGSIYEIAKLITSAKGKKKKSIKRKSKKQKSKKRKSTKRKSKKRRSTKKVLTRRVKQK